ncbi:MAG: KEOPS complex subunit Pcc1 [Nitrososphaeria archaeon]
MIKVEIQLTEKDQFLVSFKKAIEPDNINFPKGVTMEVKHEDGVLKIISQSNKESVMSMLNALDEILELAKTVERGVNDC